MFKIIVDSQLSATIGTRQNIGGKSRVADNEGNYKFILRKTYGFDGGLREWRIIKAADILELTVYSATLLLS